MSDEIPPLSGADLIKLLETDGWIVKGDSTHGKTLYKKINNKNIYTTVQKKTRRCRLVFLPKY